MPKILLVEDNEMNRDMLSRRLQRKGYAVVMAHDGEQGLALAKSESPDLILMDISLPKMDGWQVTKALKSNPDILKVHKVPNGLGGRWLIYEVAVPVQDQETAVFVSLANKNVLLVSRGKDYIVDALKKSNTTGKATLKNKDCMVHFII